ncbi:MULTISPECIES: AraC family transcriptional regulator [unclassified Imperialibacter]|uniref:helix-turn-helix domain-containing protein n=1 Tax=unclassified Imperialibacter TaxID=2629706 RepID=UPI0012592C71|nr:MULTISPECIES: helix-turn-helix transcriptional regulator [unclassified Imperialibacter]CAD5251122.1 Helix-turn-helix domain-containing protein [Imperialibacter sp. 89]CAD5284040.1 Helix-turn-helix domain-containing protein [Imperialibacter sp. 75]VVT10851.1 Helix-turn-helix domain-containing protein [Imperialibacter sp. EC-SDR9]
MKNETVGHQQFKSISDTHRAFGLPKPSHPLISLINGANTPGGIHPPSGSHVLSLYKISYKPRLGGKIKYGQHHYDFDEGGLLFASPNQVIGASDDGSTADCSLYTLLIHPDFFLGHPIAKKIRQYGFFSYTTNETLHLSEEEKETILSLFRMIEMELSSRIDDFSQDVVISQIELLLSFANRFYRRQFITRKAANHDLLEKLEELLDHYFDNQDSPTQGLPSVQFLADQLNLSPSYLSDMLRALTGQNARQHIHFKLMEKAKELLSTTSLTVSEVAYQLGFEHSQSFSKFFKTKAKLSPLEFRQSFN